VVLVGTGKENCNASRSDQAAGHEITTPHGRLSGELGKATVQHGDGGSFAALGVIPS